MDELSRSVLGDLGVLAVVHILQPALQYHEIYNEKRRSSCRDIRCRFELLTVERRGTADVIVLAMAENPNPETLPTIRVVREKMWGKYYPMVSSSFPNAKHLGKPKRVSARR